MADVVITGNVQTVTASGSTTPAVTTTSSVEQGVTLQGALTTGGITTLANLGITASSTELNYTDGVTSAIQSQLDTKAADSAVVHDTGDETVGGVKTFSSDPLIPDETYGVGWNGSLEPPTKNAVYDKVETITAGSGITEELAIAYGVAL